MFDFSRYVSPFISNLGGGTDLAGTFQSIANRGDNLAQNQITNAQNDKRLGIAEKDQNLRATEFYDKKEQQRSQQKLEVQRAILEAQARGDIAMVEILAQWMDQNGFGQAGAMGYDPNAKP